MGTGREQGGCKAVLDLTRSVVPFIQVGIIPAPGTLSIWPFIWARLDLSRCSIRALLAKIWSSYTPIHLQALKCYGQSVAAAGHCRGSGVTVLDQARCGKDQSWRCSGEVTLQPASVHTAPSRPHPPSRTHYPPPNGTLHPCTVTATEPHQPDEMLDAV